MEIRKKAGFFSITAKAKVSQKGNDYLSIGIGHAVKGQDGKYAKEYFNTIDPTDLLVLSSVCENAYHAIMDAKQKEFEKTMRDQPKAGKAAAAGPGEPFPDDEVPF